METVSTRINTTKAYPPYTFNRCDGCKGCVFVILTGHGYTDVIVCDECHRIQTVNPGMVPGPTSTVQSDDPMRRHTSVYKPYDSTAGDADDDVPGRGEDRHGPTSEVHTGHDEREFIWYLAGFIDGYADGDQGDEPAEVADSTCLAQVRSIIAGYTTGHRIG